MSSPDDNANLEMAMAGRFDDCPGAPQYEVLQPARRQGRSVTASLAALSHEQSTLTTTRSWGSSKSRHSLSSLSRKRSQNGFGVDDFDCRCDEGSSRSEESPKDEEDGEAGRAVREKGPFEVGWVGGDNDPLNPRSFHIVRKWTIVLIVSLASICV